MCDKRDGRDRDGGDGRDRHCRDGRDNRDGRNNRDGRDGDSRDSRIVGIAELHVPTGPPQTSRSPALPTAQQSARCCSDIPVIKISL